MKIKVHIERVVVEGVPLTDSSRFRRAMEKQLAEHLRRSGLGGEFQRGSAEAVLRGGTVWLGRGRDASQLGRQVADAVSQAIGSRK